MRPSDATLSDSGVPVDTEMQPSVAGRQGPPAPPGAGGVGPHPPSPSGIHQSYDLSPESGLNDSLLAGLVDEVCPEDTAILPTSPIHNTTTSRSPGQVPSPVPISAGSPKTLGPSVPLTMGENIPASHGVQAPPPGPAFKATADAGRRTATGAHDSVITTGETRADGTQGLQGPPGGISWTSAESKAPSKAQSKAQGKGETVNHLANTGPEPTAPGTEATGSGSQEDLAARQRDWDKMARAMQRSLPPRPGSGLERDLQNQAEYRAARDNVTDPGGHSMFYPRDYNFMGTHHTSSGLRRSRESHYYDRAQNPPRGPRHTPREITPETAYLRAAGHIPISTDTSRDASPEAPIIIPVTLQDQHPNAQEWHRDAGLNLANMCNNSRNESRQNRHGDPQGYGPTRGPRARAPSMGPEGALAASQIGSIPPTRDPSMDSRMDVDTEHVGKRQHQPGASSVEEPPLKKTPVPTPLATPRGVQGPLATASISYTAQAGPAAQGHTTLAQGHSASAHIVEQPLAGQTPENAHLLAQALQEINQLRGQVQDMQGQTDTYVQDQIRKERDSMMDHFQHRVDAREAQFQATATTYEQKTADDLAVAQAQQRRREDQRIAQVQRQAEATQRSADNIRAQQVEQISAAAQSQISQMQTAGVALEQQLAHAQQQATEAISTATEAENYAKDLADTNERLQQEMGFQDTVSSNLLFEERRKVELAITKSNVDRKAMEDMQKKLAQMEADKIMEIERIQRESQQKIAEKECEAQSHQARNQILERETREMQIEMARAKHGSTRVVIGDKTVQTFCIDDSRGSAAQSSGTSDTSGTSDVESSGEDQPPSVPSTESYNSDNMRETERKHEQGTEWIPDRIPLEANPDDPTDIGRWSWVAGRSRRSDGKPHPFRACKVCGELHQNPTSHYCSPKCMDNQRQAKLQEEILAAFPDSDEAKAVRAAGLGSDAPPQAGAPPTQVSGAMPADDPDADNSHVHFDSATQLLQQLVGLLKGDKGEKEETSPYGRLVLPDKLNISEGPGTRNRYNWKNSTWRVICEASGMPSECAAWLDQIIQAVDIDSLHNPGKVFPRLDALIKKTFWPKLNAKQVDEINLKEKTHRKEHNDEHYMVSGRQLVFVLWRDKERSEDEVNLENSNILLGHKFGGDIRKSQHNYRIKKMDVPDHFFAEKSYMTLLTSRYRDQLQVVADKNESWRMEFSLMNRECYHQDKPMTLELMEKAVDRWLDQQERDRIDKEGRANWEHGKGPAMGYTAAGDAPTRGDCFRWKGKGCPKGASCQYQHRPEMKGIKNRERSQSGKRGRPSRSDGKGKGKGKTHGRLVPVVVTGKGKGKGKKEGGYAIGYPKSAKGLGRAPAPKKLGKAPDGAENRPACRNYYKPEGCPYTGKDGTKKCHYWHPGLCTKFQQGTCIFGSSCIFKHAMPAQGRAAISKEEKAKKKADKKARKQAEKEGKPEPAAKAKATAKPKPKAKAKVKAKAAPGGAQYRLAAAIPQPGEYRGGQMWEDPTHIYMWVDPDMQYDQELWYEDECGTWWADYVMDDDGYDERSPWGQ